MHSLLSPFRMVGLVAVGVGLILLAGCDLQGPATSDNGQAIEEVPPTLRLLLPREIRIHPFTGTRTFDGNGGINGVDVRIQATDAYSDATKAFGVFRFELYEHQDFAGDPKGGRIAVWDVDLSQPKANLVHWDNITRTYQFKLQWNQPIQTGDRYVLIASFDSRYTPRLFHERTFIAGQ